MYITPRTPDKVLIYFWTDLNELYLRLDMDAALPSNNTMSGTESDLIVLVNLVPIIIPSQNVFYSICFDNTFHEIAKSAAATENSTATFTNQDEMSVNLFIMFLSSTVPRMQIQEDNRFDKESPLSAAAAAYCINKG
jgi:hypothetical protein